MLFISSRVSEIQKFSIALPSPSNRWASVCSRAKFTPRRYQHTPVSLLCLPCRYSSLLLTGWRTSIHFWLVFTQPPFPSVPSPLYPSGLLGKAYPVHFVYILCDNFHESYLSRRQQPGNAAFLLTATVRRLTELLPHRQSSKRSSCQIWLCVLNVILLKKQHSANGYIIFFLNSQ